MDSKDVRSMAGIPSDQIIYEAGDAVEYRLPDRKGKMHWFPGKIHGVKRIEDPTTHLIKSITYLVDTGRDERTDEHVVNPRRQEIDKRVAKLIAGGKDFVTAAMDVYKHDDLPADKDTIETIRQPEQIELTEGQLRKP
jgi:hypothetical protein